MKSKLNALVIIRKSSVEIDWILPVMERMKKQVNFNTLFLNEKSYLSLSNNKFLQRKWRLCNKNFYVQKKTDKLIYKMIRKFLINLLSANKNSFFFKFLEKLNYNIHDEFYIKKKLKINSDIKFDFILNEFQKTSFWANSIIKNNKKTKLFLFPHTTHLYKYKNDRIKIIKIANIKKNCDALFLGSKLDLGIWKNRVKKDKIHIVGHPKYDLDWQKQFLVRKNTKQKKIVFSIKNIIDESSKIHTKIYLDELYKICEKNNYFLVIKLPPFPQKEFNKMIKLFKKKNNRKFYEISKSNIFNSLANANLNINFNQSATTLDALSLNIPTIQLPAISKIKNKFGSNDSIYTELKLAYKISNLKDLEKKIKDILSNSSKTKKLTRKLFTKFFPKHKNASEVIENKILNFI